MARKSPSHTDPSALPEETAVRPRDGEASGPLRSESSSEGRAAAHGRRSHSSQRPALGSLDDRLGKKMQAASELLKDLPATDPRVRLLHVAIMRRDEALLEGLLAELNKVRPSR